MMKISAIVVGGYKSDRETHSLWFKIIKSEWMNERKWGTYDYSMMMDGANDIDRWDYIFAVLMTFLVIFNYDRAVTHHAIGMAFCRSILFERVIRFWAS